MIDKNRRVELKLLTAGIAVVGVLAFTPNLHAQTEQDRAAPTGQQGQTQMGQPGQPMGQMGQGQMGQPGQPMGQPGQPMGQPGQPMGQPGQRQMGQGQMGQPGQPMGQPGQRQMGQGQMGQGQMGQPGQPMGQPGQRQMGQGQMGQGQMGQPGQPMGQPGQRQMGQGQMGQGQMGQAGQQEAGTRLYVSSESIRNIQQALKERDHDLRVDGKWGPQTSSAVREFQQKEGLEETGQLNLSTLQALGVAEQLGFQEVDTGQQRQRNDGGNRQQGYENRQGDPQQRQQQ